jgi:hypothetical protein
MGRDLSNPESGPPEAGDLIAKVLAGPGPALNDRDAECLEVVGADELAGDLGSRSRAARPDKRELLPTGDALERNVETCADRDDARKGLEPRAGALEVCVSGRALGVLVSGQLYADGEKALRVVTRLDVPQRPVADHQVRGEESGARCQGDLHEDDHAADPAGP